MTKQAHLSATSVWAATAAALLVVCLVLATLAGGCGPAAGEAAPDTTSDSGAEPEVELFPAATSAGVWGYVDKTGAMVIPARFAEAAPFSGGLAAVRPEALGPWGYIDQTGKTVIEPQFADAAGFSEGLAPVRLDVNGSWGFADTTGAVVIPPQFADAREFSEGLARVRSGQESGYVDGEGKWAIRMADYEAVGEFTGGLALVYQRSTDLYGFINKDGGVAITPAYADAWGFSEGLAAVCLPTTGDDSPTSGLYGFIDKDGDWVIQPKFADARPFSEGLAAAQSTADGNWGYVDITGEPVIPGQWDEAGMFRQGLALVALVVGDNEDGYLVYGYAYIGMDGSVIWQDQAYADFKAGRTTTTLVTGKVSTASDIAATTTTSLP